MSRRILMTVFALLSALFLMTGCGADNGDANNINNNSTNNVTNNENNANETENESEDAVVEVEFTISKDEGEEVIETKTIEIEEGDVVLDVLKDNFDVEENDGFVTSINGVSEDPDNQIGWIYFVNDEMAMVGAAEYELKADDQVNFDLQSWE